jgi:hypothetical protein
MNCGAAPQTLVLVDRFVLRRIWKYLSEKTETSIWFLNIKFGRDLWKIVN